jgi:hypothetical protein
MAKPAQSHWALRADDYRQLAKDAANPEVRQVLEHLERTCRELARSKAAGAKSTPARSWMDEQTRQREGIGTRWRLREAEYLAMAESCNTSDGQNGWRVLAGRAREIAEYLEATSSATT